MNVPEFIKKIDFTELRNQKSTLMLVIGNMETDSTAVNNEVTNKMIASERRELEGILQLIDDIQSYVVETNVVNGIHVYDFELEEQRDASTPEEIFARENADTIFQMHIEGTFLYDEESSGMPKEFIESIIDDKMHASLIKNLIRLEILDDLKEYPSSFERDADGKLTYDANMYDYGFNIEAYCKEKFNETQLVQKWCCSNCGSQNAEIKKWVNVNTNEVGTDCEDEYGWCPDCEGHHEVELRTFNLNGKEVQIATTDGQSDPNK